MCGIVYSKSLVDKPVNKTIQKRYLKQRSRGSDGFGFYVPETNRLTHNPREGRILSLLRRQKKATEILFHHRMPTSTINVRNACHPFSTKDYFTHNYVLVHNGVLWNEGELKEQHEFRGIKYVSEQENGSYNDSEALAFDVARYLENEVDKITAEGSIAFICIKRTHEGEPIAVYFGRNSGNPLMMKKTDTELTLASEGDGVLIEPNMLFCYNYKTGVITSSPLLIPSAYKGSQGYGYAGWNDLDEDDEYEILNRGYHPSSKDTAQYFVGLDEKGQTWAESELRRLLDENYEVPHMAIEAGRDELADLRKITDGLKHNVEVLGIASPEDTERFYMIEDRIFYLGEAIRGLVMLDNEVASSGGGLAKQPMGFHYTPDHLDYGLHMSSRDRALEKTDPLTGFLYYPYAE